MPAGSMVVFAVGTHPPHVGVWRAREARLRDAGKEPFVLTFPAALSKDTTTTLRTARFRFSKVLQHWEGIATPDDAEALAAASNGTVRRISAPAAPETGRQEHPGKQGPTANDPGPGEPDNLLKRAKHG